MLEEPIRKEIECMLKFMLDLIKHNRVIEFSIEYNFLEDRLTGAIRHGEGQGAMAIIDKDFKKRKRKER